VENNEREFLPRQNKDTFLRLHLFCTIFLPAFLLLFARLSACRFASNSGLESFANPMTRKKTVIPFERAYPIAHLATKTPSLASMVFEKSPFWWNLAQGLGSLSLSAGNYNTKKEN
jgi:hypothetical protein